MPFDPLTTFGRGLVIAAGRSITPPWDGCDVVTIDAATLADPAHAVTQLFGAWIGRRPVVVALGVDPATFRARQSITGEPWTHTPATEPFFDRLHFLVWANNYDGRGDGVVWWWGRKTARLLPGGAVLEAMPGANPLPTGDVRLTDGTVAWIDGGPRRPWSAGEGEIVIHSESVEAGTPTPTRSPVDPAADATIELAADQRAAVSHEHGAARIIAPAGSGKTRVLTERLRHVVVDRGYDPATVLAVAYNKEAEREMTARTADFAPHVRTLNALGLWVLRRHHGRLPEVVDEREVRRLIDSLLPGTRRRRANVDPIGPYLEALAAIRLGLRDPAEVEDSRDDVDGLAELFPRYRQLLRDRGVLDFDEQIYAAIEVLLADGEFRGELQRSCRHLLVDEFQDLTPAHVLLIRLLSLPALDVFGVGDDDQCIYGHAGADPGFLIDYRTLFPGAGEHALRVNYRCPVAVVEAATTLLGYNHRRVAKEILAGPGNDATPDALRLVDHAADESATAVADVVAGWLADGTAPASMAVLARVNSLLLAPHVALHAAGVPLNSVVAPDLLGRTGLRAALAYLRIAADPDGFDSRAVVEILRRPSRGLPQWFGERISRRRTWTVATVEQLAQRVPDKDVNKVLDLATDLRLVVDAGRIGTVRDVLEVVRDVVGLGSAMSLLDRTGGGQGSSHLDDLDGLIAVADLHPELATFEQWLGEAFRAEHDPAGVTVSTIHRVKGREWDRVAVFGVADGIVPHRLATDVEEERRVLHVGITRGRHRVTILADGSRPSPFLDELSGIAPKVAPRPRPAREMLRTAPRRPAAPAAEIVLSPDAVAAEHALRAWRTQRAKADGVPAYVVLNDRHLRGIAVAKPATATALAACDGIGAAKLERYGDEILDVLSGL